MSKYYDDALEAAYMAREHGVKVQGYYNVTKNLGDVLSWENIMENRHFPKYYIHEDSLPIFEPKHGDWGRGRAGQMCCYVDDELKWYVPQDEVRIV